ncbi:Plasmodium vivax Vir protein, putative [Plasmodium vivax]|uniref:Vir protein, putative n=1 Tax=Plasmodium vivax TaxID=5855 RepID=A0A1G4EA28_PLAVI|nr:Plasmodium vivax Vir protein, putative [Plasmodium vivax]
MGFGVEDYCRYINYWINGKVRESKYQKYRDHFKIFEDFVHNYAYEKQRNHTASCKSYIHKMEDADYNRMETLYKFYTFYDKLNLYARSVSNPECDNLSYYIALYNDVINDYYDNYRDLYNKINHVKNLIVSLVSNPTLSCKRYANFHAATNFLLDEQLKKEQARKEALEREQAEKAALAREQAEKAALARTQELEIESSRRIQPMQKTTEELQAGLRQGDTRMGVELEDLRTSRNLRVQEHSHVLSYPERSHNLGKLTEYRESSLSEQDEGQFEGVVSQSESEGTPKDSSFLSSLRIPRYITGVLGEIDPVPVVGVSGGMGALFLLFRYTPFGNFFRGGRGRAHRIPRSLIQCLWLVYLVEWVLYFYFLGIHHLETSSEEEEDAHIESLVVSMDNS